MNVNENREVRGRILKILQVNYPRPTTEKLVEVTLGDMEYEVTPGSLGVHLSYLEEKEYIEHEEASGRKMVRLTAKGVDLIEGNIEGEPGVMLDE